MRLLISNSDLGIRQLLLSLFLFGIYFKSSLGEARKIQINGTNRLGDKVKNEVTSSGRRQEQHFLDNQFEYGLREGEIQFEDYYEDNDCDEDEEGDNKMATEGSNPEKYFSSFRASDQSDFTSFDNTSSDSYNADDFIEDIPEELEDSSSERWRNNSEKQLPGEDGKNEAENREFAFYMFQGQYMAEPRLNLFVDGAIRNFASEMKVETMDPLYFRVLPKGQVVSRTRPQRRGNDLINRQPVKRQNGKQNYIRNQRRRRRPGVRRRRRRKTKKRNPKQLGRFNRFRNRGKRRRVNNLANRRNRNRPKRQHQRRVQNRRKQRNVKRGVGSGRVEGLSKVERDGDAEMQVFGNYTMIRCHARMGPVVLNMQFRTRRGLRSTGATLPELKLHTVTRVSPAGSELVDFVLDRPHAETIKLRGKLFPLAERVAKNIFARLFMPGSFLVARIREKSAIAMLSKPKVTYG